MPELTGGKAVVETLKAAGVDIAFGIISVHNIPIYDAMARDDSLRPVAVRHEQAAVYMADGYARATGRLGVAITSSGPGAANSVGAMLEAYTASSKVLQITGQINTPFLDQGKGFLHEAKDQLGMLRTVTGFAARVTAAEAIPDVIHQAIRHIHAGRWRPAAVEIPIDLQHAQVEAAIPQNEGFPRKEPATADIARAAELLRQAQRPLIWAGGGVIAADAADELRLLAERLGAAVITSINGRGSIPENHPLCIGNFSSDLQVRQLVQRADLLLAVGTRFQGNVTGNWRMELPHQLLHIDIDPHEIGRNYPVALGIIADAKMALRRLLDTVDAHRQPDEAYLREIQAVREQARATARSSLGPYEEMMDDLRATLADDAIVVCDATVPAYTWGNRLLEIYQPRTFIYPSTGAIGPGLPLALGAKAGRPDRQVVAICGDGGFMLNLSELATAVQHNLAVVALLFNDRGYGVLRIIQDRQFEGRRIAVDLHTPDFVAVGQGFGVWARRVSSVKEFKPALQAALESGRPALLEIDMGAIGPLSWGSPQRSR